MIALLCILFLHGASSCLSWLFSPRYNITMAFIDPVLCDFLIHRYVHFLCCLGCI